MEEKPCTNFCDVLISFYEVINLQNFEFGVSDVIPTNVQSIHLWFYFYFILFFLILWNKNFR